MSLWSCPDHGLVGPGPCCGKSSLARIVANRCVWKEIPPADRFSSAFPPFYTIGCNGERSAGMTNGRPYSWCPFCGKEIESVESQSDAREA